MGLLKVNGFYNVCLYSHNINKDSLKKQFMKRCWTKISEYLNLQDNENYQYQSYLENNRIIEHRKTVTTLRASSTCLVYRKAGIKTF